MANTTESSEIIMHGWHPLRGCPVTWHLTPLGAEHTGYFKVEWADGRIEDDEAWRLAYRQRAVLSAPEVAQLVRRVDRRAS